MMIIWCMFPEIKSATGRIFCHFGQFFVLLPLEQPGKSKNWKKWKKNACRYYHFTHVYHKWKSYDVSFLMYPFAHFLPKKSKFYKNEKKHMEISSFYICLPKNYDKMMYGFWDMVCNRWTDGWTEKVTYRGGWPT